jgi:hypothetical protein
VKGSGLAFNTVRRNGGELIRKLTTTLALSVIFLGCMHAQLLDRILGSGDNDGLAQATAIANQEIKRSVNLLRLAEGYKRADQVMAARTALEAEIQGNRVREIKKKTRILIDETLPLEAYVREQTAKREQAFDREKSRFQSLNDEKQRLVVILDGLEDLGPLPSVERTATLQQLMDWRRTVASGGPEEVERLRAESAKVEQQIPLLRGEVEKRKQQALAYSREVLQKTTAPIPEAKKLSDLIEQPEISAADVIEAYRTAKKLDGQLRALAAATQRAESVIASARIELASAAKYPTDKEVGPADRATTQAMNDLAGMVGNAVIGDERHERQITILTEKLSKEASRLAAVNRQHVALSTATGKRVYNGCYAWAKRTGMASSVQVFKDDAKNAIANQGEQLCRCIAAEIAGDREITDEAKLAIAHEFETTDRMRDQQLALIVGVASAKCQIAAMRNLSGR